METGAKVVVLTALPVEYAAVRAHLRDVQRRGDPSGTQFEVGTLAGTTERVAVAEVGPGNLDAALVAAGAISAFGPEAVLFVGVAGTLTDLDLGDVVVATRVYAYGGGKEQDDGFAPRPRAFESDHELVQRARYVARAFQQRPGAPAVRFAPVAAGEVVLNSRTTPLAEQLRNQYSDAAAIEMESAGMARAGDIGRVRILTIRGISDRADGLKAEADAGGSQQVAATNAAAFAAAVITDYLSGAASGGRGTRRRALLAAAAVVVAAVAAWGAISAFDDDTHQPAVAACDYKLGEAGVVDVKAGAAAPDDLTVCPALLNNGSPLTGAFTVAGRFGGPDGNYRDLVVVGRADPKVCDVYGHRPVAGYFYQSSARIGADGRWSFRDGVGYQEAVTLARDYQFIAGSPEVLAAIRSDRSLYAEKHNGDDGYTGMADLPPDARVVATFRQPPGTYEGKGPAKCKNE